MLADFPLLHVDLIVKRTIGSCVVLAVVALVASILVGQPLVGLGVLLGLGGATANHRLFQVTTAHYSDGEGHLERKPYFGSVAARLGTLTVVAFALLFLLKPMGFGMIGGLVAFQMLLMANAFGALWHYQKVQLSGVTRAPGAALVVDGRGAQAGPVPPGPSGKDV
jgi:hypothetical protein